MELNFTVTNQKIKYVSNLYIVEKSKNYLTAKFTFSGSEWKNVAKTAIFKKDDTVINVVLDESGRCEVPWEVITKGTLRVSVFGGDLVTVDTADVKILKSGYEEGNAPSKPTPDVYAQILSELQSIREEAITEEMVGQAVEDWLADNVVEALSPEDVEKIVYGWLETHKEELKGEKGEPGKDGKDGTNGVTYTPNVSEDGVLSWSNDGEKENPSAFDFKSAFGITEIKEDIEELQNKTDITRTTSTTQPNSYAGREHILEIGGVMEQDSTSGKNLLENIASTTTKNGIAFTVNADRSVTVNGTNSSTSHSYYSFGSINLIAGQEYVLSGCPSGGASDKYFMYFDGVSGAYDVGDGKTYTPTENEIRSIGVCVRSGVTVSNLVFKPMVRLSSVTDATYEPYTGGIPAPSPSYPQEIKKSVVSGIRTHHKNFLKNEWENKLPTSENTNPLRARCKKVIPIRKGVAYTFSANDYTTYKYALNASRTIAYPFNINEIHSLGNSADWLNKDFTFTALDDGYLSVVVSRVDNTDLSLEEVAKLKIQFEEGTVATEYEPYTEKAITFSQPIELYGIGDVQDIIAQQNVGRKFAKVVLNGSEAWSKEAGFDYVFRFRHGLSNVISYSENQLCTHLLRSNSYNDLTAKVGYFAISTNSILVNVSGITTSADLKSFLAENPMTFVFDLSEETTEALPIADQIALNSLPTYDGITYVEFDSEIQPTFKAEYGTSKVGGYTLEGMLAGRNGELYGKDYNSRLSALEASVVNNI